MIATIVAKELNYNDYSRLYSLVAKGIPLRIAGVASSEPQRDALFWHPAVLGYKLFDNQAEVASIRGSFAGFPHINILGTYSGRRVEINHIKGQYSPFDYRSEKSVIYSIMLENHPGEWDDSRHKNEWGTLEDNSFTPRPVPLRSRRRIRPICKPQWVNSIAGRRYSIDLSRTTDSRRIYTFTDCTEGEVGRLMAVTSCNWSFRWGFTDTFREIDFRPDDPNPLFVAIISYAAADLARTIGNPSF